MRAIPGAANILTLPAVAVADGSPIVAGTVNFYLIALSGAELGQWWNGAAWAGAEAVAGAGGHMANGHWIASIAAAAWTEGVQYYAYLQEDGGLHIPVGMPIYCSETADAVLDELLAGHVVAGSLGARIGLLGTGVVTVANPIAANLSITIVGDDDYLAADSRQLSWTVENWAAADPATGTVTLQLTEREDYAAGTHTGDVLIAGTGSLVGVDALFEVDLTAAQTRALASTPPATGYQYVYQVILTLPGVGGSRITVARGHMLVVGRVGAEGA